MKEFAAHAKEYAAFKQAHTLQLRKEERAILQVQNNALDSIAYLPDYLFDEATSETGATISDEMHEFMPAVLYME